MSLRIQRSEWFIADLEHYAAWYDSHGSWDVAERYLQAVNATLARLSDFPGLGHPTRLAAPEIERASLPRGRAAFSKASDLLPSRRKNPFRRTRRPWRPRPAAAAY